MLARALVVTHILPGFTMFCVRLGVKGGLCHQTFWGVVILSQRWGCAPPELFWVLPKPSSLTDLGNLNAKHPPISSFPPPYICQIRTSPFWITVHSFPIFICFFGKAKHSRYCSCGQAWMSSPMCIWGLCTMWPFSPRHGPRNRTAHWWMINYLDSQLLSVPLIQDCSGRPFRIERFCFPIYYGIQKPILRSIEGTWRESGWTTSYAFRP